MCYVTQHRHKQTKGLKTTIWINVCIWMNCAPLKQTLSIQRIGTRLRLTARLSDSCYLEPCLWFVGKSCFLLLRICLPPPPQIMWQRKEAGMFDRPVICHRARNFGGGRVGKRCMCLQTHWVGFIHQWALELSARSASVWSCGACGWRLPENQQTHSMS